MSIVEEEVNARFEIQDTRYKIRNITNKGNNKITELRTILQREDTCNISFILFVVYSVSITEQRERNPI
jgi:hypothetical protein